MATAFRPRKRGVSYSEALAAAYASAPEAEITLDTLEFRHPSFIVDGVPVAGRVVNDHKLLNACLEADAPMNPGEYVDFHPVAFRFTRPKESESGSTPVLTLTVDNAARILIPYLDMAKESRIPIEVTWRPYLASDLTTPHMDPPLTLTLRTAAADMNTVTAQAGFADFSNLLFPGREYTAAKFPGLSAR